MLRASIRRLPTKMRLDELRLLAGSFGEFTLYRRVKLSDVLGLPGSPRTQGRRPAADRGHRGCGRPAVLRQSNNPMARVFIGGRGD